MNSPFNPANFLLLPVQLLVPPACDWKQVQDVYREAYEQAREAARPRFLDRVLSISLN
jgi:hypothetical protein